MRPKTKFRLLILLLLTICIAGALSGLYLYREQQARHQLNVDRGLGMEAFRDRDYATAIKQLTPYVNHRPDDAEALYALALSQLSKPNPLPGDISDALERLRRYLEMVPGNLDAAHRLLELEQNLRHWDQVIDLARQIITTAPDDPAALSSLAMGLETDGKSDEALAPAEHYNQIVPTDLQGHELTYTIMHSLKTPLSKMLERARQFEKQYPNDPRFKLGEVLAYTLGKGAEGDAGPQTVEIGKQETQTLFAATDPPALPPDAQFVHYAVGLLDDNLQYEKSLDLLRRASAVPEVNNDVSIKELYVRRLWETHQYGQAVQAAGTLSQTSPASLVAYAYMAQAALDLENNEYATTLANLLNSLDDPDAKSWIVGLRNEPDSGFVGRFDRFQQGLAIDHNNGVLHFRLAQAYADASEDDLALEEGKAAAELLPSWPDPHLLLANLLAGRGEILAALRESDLALVTAAANRNYGLDPQVIRAEIAFRYAESLGQSEPKQNLLNLLDAFHKEHPEETRILPAYVQLLAETGQIDQAKKILSQEFGDPHVYIPGGEALALQLVEASRSEKLGMESQLIDAAMKSFGLTPKLGFARANEMAADGKWTTAQALAYLQTCAEQKPDYLWSLYIARFREDAHDPGAAAAWVALGNTYPGLDDIQFSILDPTIAPSAWKQQHEFVGTTIERVRAITGDSALGWKIAKARWLLQNDDAKSAGDASFLLSDVLKHPTAAQRSEGHELQAEAMEKLGNFDGAANELSQAWLLSPGDTEIGYSLLRVFHRAGRDADAIDAFDRLKSLPLSTDESIRAASVMYDQDELSRASDLLKAHDDPANPSTELIGLLAMAEQRMGQVKDAGDAYLRVLDAKPLSADVAAAGADFFASLGDTTTANKFLARMAADSANTTDRQLRLAAFQENYGKDLSAVDELYRNAIKSSPESSAAPAAYLGYLIRRGRLDDAKQISDSALQAFPGDARLTSLQTLAADLRDPRLAVDLAPLAAILTPSAGDASMRDMLAALAEASGNINDRLQALIEKYPNFYPLYDVEVRHLMAVGRTDAADKAVEIASDAMDKFRDQPLAARLACVSQAEEGHWTAALTAAQQWRARAYREPLDADWHIALCLINLGRPAEAINRLEPYVIDAKSASNNPLNRQIMRTYAGALIAADRVDDAKTLLEPLAAASVEWRMVWLGLAKDSFSQGTDAAAWLTTIAPRIPPQNTAEIEMLAQAWFDVAGQKAYPAGFAQCRDLLKPLESKLEPRSLLLLAMAEEQTHDPDAADDYRHVIDAAQAGHGGAFIVTAAQNNLANLLIDQPGALATAESLAHQAVDGAAADPKTQSYYLDTLGHVFLMENKAADAATQFARADQIRPNDVAVLIGWSDSLLKMGKSDEALSKLQAADKVLAAGAKPSAKLQAELDEVREGVAASITVTPTAKP